MRQQISVISLLLLLFGVTAASPSSGYDGKRPNFLIIVADDLGLTDLGYAGSEIATPNLDLLAESGLKLTNFYVAANCSPTRSMLLSGTDHHLAGLGVMHEVMNDSVRGQPGYEGYLNDRIVPLPERLRQAGYHTYMTGKWHLGLESSQSANARGFEKSFTLLHGGASHFDDMRGNFSFQPVAAYLDGNTLVEELPEGFFSSTFYSDQLMRYIEADRNDEKPFFAYLAYTAPHWPLQAPDSHIDRYKGVYDKGWDTLREKRLKGLIARGFFPSGTLNAQRPDRVKPWNSLSPEERQHFARRMEVYAAMVEHLDEQIGRVLRYLDSIGELKDTHVFFFSDNGPEGNDAIDILDNREWVPEEFDNSLANMGHRNSYISQGPGWAQVSAVPFRLFKSFPSEGGVRVPAIYAPAGPGKKRESADALLSVMDIAPTILELAGVAEDPREGKLPITGISMAPYLDGRVDSVRDGDDFLGWELFGRAGIRQDKWKLTRIWPPFGNGEWSLYDLQKDPAEQNNLVEQNPRILSHLMTLWHRYVKENGVIVIEQDAGYAK